MNNEGAPNSNFLMGLFKSLLILKLFNINIFINSLIERRKYIRSVLYILFINATPAIVIILIVKIIFIIICTPKDIGNILIKTTDTDNIKLEITYFFIPISFDNKIMP